MYNPTHFSETDGIEIARLCQEYPLALIVAADADGLTANHVPLLRDGADFIGHVALANPVHGKITSQDPVLAVFTAGDGYVSPNWYPSKAETHKAVPTWNYQAVHVHGHFVFSHGDAIKRRVVSRLTHHFESLTNGSSGWKMGDAPSDYLQTMLDGIVAFRLVVTRIEAKSKLSQNRNRADRDGVENGFEGQGNTLMTAAMGRQNRD